MSAGSHHDVRGEVASLVRSVPGWAGTEPTVTALDGGITNQNFRVDVGGGSYVVRIPGARTELLGVNREVEAEVARRAADLGIGPPVVAVLPGYPTLITALVPGHHAATSADFATAPRLERVVATVARLHRSGPVQGAFLIHRVIERHAHDAIRHGVSLPAGFDDLHRFSLKVERAFADAPRPAVPCHNDLLPGNVLFDGEHVWLLDFEYAGMNDASFDLANLSVNAALSDDDDERVLLAYYGQVNAPDWARLQLMKVLSELREGMWAVVQQAISTLDGFDFAAYAQGRLASAVQLSERPEVELWLGDAASGLPPA